MPIVDPQWPRADEWLASGAEQPKLIVVGVPSSSSSLVPSEAFRAPGALRQTLGAFSTFHGELEVDLRSLPVADRGDWNVAELPAREAAPAIRDQARSLPIGPIYLFLGGDNAITLPLVSGLAVARLDRVGLLTVDAHHDVRSTEQGPTNGSPVRGLIEAGLPGRNVAQVGISLFSNSAEYRRYCSQQGFLIVTMDDVSEWGIEEAVNVALVHLSDRCDWIYVDFDLDVVDRAFAPACPGSRPGGMTPRQLAAAARICGRHPQVQAADLVEVDPNRDRDEITLMAMATTLLSFAAGLASRPGGHGDESSGSPAGPASDARDLFH